MCNIGQKVMCPGVATRAKPDTAPGRTLSPLRLGVLVTEPARFLAGVPGQRLNQRGGAAGQRGPLSVSLPLAFFFLSFISHLVLLDCRQHPVCRASTGIPKSAHIRAFWPLSPRRLFVPDPELIILQPIIDGAIMLMLLHTRQSSRMVIVIVN